MSFQQGLSGLNAASKNLDAIGNNVSNANTVGYKSSAAQFSDVFAGALASGGTQIGIGTSLAEVAQNFSQGNINTTSNALDVAINGKGFFRMDNAGTITYSRNGQFQMDKQGYLVNAKDEKLTGYSVDANGVISTASVAPIKVTMDNISPKPSTTSTLSMNLDSGAAVTTVTPFNPTTVGSYTSSTSFTVYDQQGKASTLGLYMAKSATNTWDVYGTLDGTAMAAKVGTLTFGNNGVLAGGSPMTATLSATNPLLNNVALNFTGTTQFGSAFGVNQITQDGYTAGKVTGFNIGTDGVIQARYSNGQSRPQAQIILANFTNVNGLQQLGGNAWAETSESGPAINNSPGTGLAGALQAGAVEEANVDLTAELVNMITAQRVYQANAQTIKTEDSVMQTLVNLR